MIADTWWSDRRNNHTDLLSLLVANSVTGAASLLRRELLADALPFPPAQFAHFHDHWLALVALSLGEIAYVDRPLYDYVQHGEASLGHAAANQMTSLRDRLRSAKPLRERIAHVAAALLRRRLAAAAVRRDPRAARRRAHDSRPSGACCSRFDEGDRVAGRADAAGLRAARASWSRRGRRRSAPSGCWRTPRLAAAAGGDRARPAADAAATRRAAAADVDPAARRVGCTSRRGRSRTRSRRCAGTSPRRARADQHPDPDDRPDALLRRLHRQVQSRRGWSRPASAVRIVTVDPVGPLPRDWRATIESYSGLHGLFDRDRGRCSAASPRRSR